MLNKTKKIYFLLILLLISLFLTTNLVFASAIDLERNGSFNLPGKFFFLVIVSIVAILPFLPLIIFYLVYSLFFNKNSNKSKYYRLKMYLLVSLILVSFSIILLLFSSYFTSTLVFDFYGFIFGKIF